MNISWHDTAWNDYLFWQKTDKKVLKKINTLIKDIKRQPYEGLGNPEQLRHEWSGYWSRRINLEHRLVYKVENENIVFAQCKDHY